MRCRAFCQAKKNILVRGEGKSKIPCRDKILEAWEKTNREGGLDLRSDFEKTKLEISHRVGSLCIGDMCTMYFLNQRLTELSAQ